MRGQLTPKRFLRVLEPVLGGRIRRTIEEERPASLRAALGVDEPVAPPAPHPVEKTE